MRLSLVVGGAGFLGSHLVDALLEAGENVVIADDLRSGSLANIEHSLRAGRATFVYVDEAQSAENTRAAIVKASRSQAIRRIFHFDSVANLEALIDLAIENGSCLIYVSAWETAGDPPLHSEPASGEAAISSAAMRRGLDARIVRLSDCYGPRMARTEDGFIFSLADAIEKGAPLPIHGDGLQSRSMIFVDDAIHLLLAAANTPQGLTPVYIGDHVQKTSLGDGLATTIAWMRANAGAY